MWCNSHRLHVFVDTSLTTSSVCAHHSSDAQTGLRTIATAVTTAQSMQHADVRYRAINLVCCHVLAQADSRRVMTFSNEEDVVFFRHHMYEKRGGKDVVLHEVGPRFEMQLYQLRLGTLDQVIIDFQAAWVQCRNTSIHTVEFSALRNISWWCAA